MYSNGSPSLVPDGVRCSWRCAVNRSDIGTILRSGGHGKPLLQTSDRYTMDPRLVWNTLICLSLLEVFEGGFVPPKRDSPFDLPCKRAAAHRGEVVLVSNVVHRRRAHGRLAERCILAHQITERRSFGPGFVAHARYAKQRDFGGCPVCSTVSRSTARMRRCSR